MPLEQKSTIKYWAKDDQPREKLRLKGGESLSTSELIAILINNGTKQKSAVDIAKNILSLGKNELNALGKLSVKELMKVNGVGEAKAIIIVAALELGKRRSAEEWLRKPVISDSGSIARYLQARFADYAQEVFAAVYLNRANKINHIEMVSKGGITATVADPRIILKKALEEDAVNIILCHNHPSGSLRPSRADIDLTKKIKDAASFFDIKLLDHLIVSQEGYFSFADEGMI